MADFFRTRETIAQEIQDKIQGIRKVYYAEDLDGVTEKGQIAPAVHLLYAGYTPAQAERARSDISLDQTWAVVLVVKQARKDYQGGELLDELIRVLHGFQPGQDLLKLQLAPSTFSPTYRPGIAYFPLAFTTRYINRKGA